jgi:hypothetical protein
MSLTSLAVTIVTLTASVVLAIFVVLWPARTTVAQSGDAVVSAVVLAGWALGAATGGVVDLGLFMDGQLVVGTSEEIQ